MDEDQLIEFEGMKGCRISSYNDALWTPNSRKTREKISETWQRKVRENASLGGFLQNGVLVRANNMFLGPDNVLEIEAQRTDYLTHVSTRDDPTITPHEKARAIYVAGMITTSDGYLVFGTGEATEDKWIGIRNIVAGGLEPSDIGEHDVLGGALSRELLEELGDKALGSCEKIVPSYVARERVATHPSIVFEVSTSCSRQELRGLFSEHNSNLRKSGCVPEFSRLGFVKKDVESIERELESNPEAYQERIQVILAHTMRKL